MERLIASPASLAQFAPAIAWLRQKHVPVNDLARAFDTTPNHIGVLAYRGRQTFDAVTRPLRRPNDGVGVRVHPSRVADLEEALDGIRARHLQTHDFPGALIALRHFRPHLGRPVSTEMKRVLVRWHFWSAWFAVHCGYTTTALEQATAAVWHCRWLFAESEDKADLKQLADAALIASHAYLFVNEPERSLKFLAIFRDASERAGNSLGGDYHRQLGTAYALKSRATASDVDYATRVLASVPRAMERRGEAQSEAQLRFAARQCHLLREHADVGACQDLIEIAHGCYGDDSLEAVIATNYASAGALTTDSDSHVDVYDRLEQSMMDATRFPHQWAVAQLLLLTPQLGLDHRLRGEWVRQVSYLNPLRRY